MTSNDVALGPLELLALKFPGNQFTEEIIAALDDLVQRGAKRIVDVVFASKSQSGELRMLELADLDGESFAALEPLVDDILGILSEEDVWRMGAVLQNGSSAGLILFEDTWARRLSEAVERAHGEVVFREPVPEALVGRILTAQRAAYAAAPP